MNRIMTKRKKSKELLPYNWLTLDKPNAQLIDPEMVELTVLSAEQKYNEALANKDFSHFHEIVYHALNLNTFMDESRMYDDRLKKVKDDPMLDKLVRDYKDDPRYGDVAGLVRNVKNIFKNNIEKHLDEMIEFLSKGEYYFENNKLHQNNDCVYIVITDGIKPKHQVWKLKFGNEFRLNYDLSMCFEVDLAEDDSLLVGAITEYNKTAEFQIDTENTFGIITNRKKSITQGLYLAKDIIMMNKVFIGPKEFNVNILKNLYNVVHGEKEFMYHLTPGI